MKTLLLGDLSPTAVTNPLFEKKDIEGLFSDTVSLFEGNDVNFVNLECALTDYDKAIEKFGPPLKATPKVAEVLKEIGVNYCGVSNNHFFDYGKKGVKDTINALDAAGLIYTGYGKDYADSRRNLVIEKNGEKICIIAVCEHEYSYALENREGCRGYDEYDTIEDIRNAKAECDRVIVIYHGGKEHCQYPSPRLHKACRAMVRSGADVVLCQHSHCIGCYEEYNGCHILYGQGNFHFVKPEFVTKENRETWDTSLAVKYDTVTNGIEFIPVTAENDGVTLAKGELRSKIIREFETRSKQLESGEWRNGWREFCVKTQEIYVNAVKNAGAEDLKENPNQLFAHYLDCEAHTDVWRELFQTANMTNEK